MRMIKPSPGECADRQTILHLKMKFADAGELKTRLEDVYAANQEKPHGVNRTVVSGISKVDLQPFQFENEEIQRYLEQYWFPDFPKIGEQYDELFDTLADVNEKLWKLEDEARVLRKAKKDQSTMYRAGTVLFMITEENDRRAELVQNINKLFGIDVREKVYAGQ